LQCAIEAVLDLPAKRIGVIGLTFKENTDHLRESPVVILLEQLIGKGWDVRVCDPHIRLDEIYGANRNFILETILHIGRLLVSDIDQILSWADYVVLAQKQNSETMERIYESGLPTVDLVRGSLKASAAGSAMSPAG
jgi:GDP-mannose 6-dehydrogenase